MDTLTLWHNARIATLQGDGWGLLENGAMLVHDVHVDVFQGLAEGEAALRDLLRDLRQALTDRGLLLGGQDPYMRQHRGMGEASLDVYLQPGRCPDEPRRPAA